PRMQRNIIDAGANAIRPVTGLKILDLLEVIGLDGIGIDLQDLPGLIILQLEHALEGKHGLGLVENMKDDDVVTREPEAVESPQNRLGVGQQVTEDHDQAAVADHAGDLVQAGFDIGLAGGLEPGKQGQNVAELRALAPRREALTNLLVERDQANRVLLVDHQVAERSRQADAVLELGQLLAVGVTHRPRQVHHQVAGQVGLGLELLDVEAVGLGVDVPVHIRNVVARGVLAVLGELHREALERAGMQPRDKALDDELGAQVQPRHLADDLGLQILFGGGHGPASSSSLHKTSKILD